MYLYKLNVGDFQDVPPVLAAPHHYLISIQRGGVALVAVSKQEVAPLFVIEFLHRVVDTFQVRSKLIYPKCRWINKNLITFYYLECIEKLYVCIEKNC